MSVSRVLKLALAATAIACAPVRAQHAPAPAPDTSVVARLDAACGRQEYTDSLRINPDTTFTYMTRMGQQQGEQQLVELAKHADQEESWLYFPRSELWLEVGYKNFKDPDKIGVSLAERDACIVFFRRAQAVHYHIHYHNMDFVHDIVSLMQHPTARLEHNLGTVYTEMEAMPSGDDIVLSLRRTVLYSAFGGNLEDRVASQWGIAKLEVYPDSADYLNLRSLNDQLDSLYLAKPVQNAGGGLLEQVPEALLLLGRLQRLEQLPNVYRSAVHSVEMIRRE